VLASIDTVLHALARLAGQAGAARRRGVLDEFRLGETLLGRHADVLLGPAPDGRAVRIMVTMPGEAAEDYTLVRRLLEGGMNCMRINCAHDDASAWERMIRHLERARKATGLECRVLMDLGGPKLRTGAIAAAPAVCKLRPGRDAYGRVLRATRVWLSAAETPHPAPAAADIELQVPAGFIEELRPGDEVSLRDARESRRRFTVLDVTPRGAWVAGDRTTYLVPGLVLTLERESAGLREGTIGPLPVRPGALLLAAGDTLLLRRSAEEGRPATRDTQGAVLTPAFISCTMPEIFADVQSGEPIWFDDGCIGGVIERVGQDELQIRITFAPPGGARLRADKGINLPESQLRIPALTEKDLADIPFVAAHADMVALSFASSAEDVRALHGALARHAVRRPAVVLKIETQRGFRNLPSMLLAALAHGPCGVMIARGDLAVECGFERLAEVQEEILWLCEAAHVPVIWATQVLESLARTGLPSRAEITDAAMGNRAECVMLNKGPHIIDALEMLADILVRMQDHQHKKRSMLRALSLAQIDVTALD
jgi:pyruvate kinase